MKTLRSLWVSKDGGTAIEYALIGALISTIMVIGLTSIGNSVNAMFASVVAGFSN